MKGQMLRAVAKSHPEWSLLDLKEQMLLKKLRAGELQLSKRREAMLQGNTRSDIDIQQYKILSVEPSFALLQLKIEPFYPKKKHFLLYSGHWQRLEVLLEMPRDVTQGKQQPALLPPNSLYSRHFARIRPLRVRG
jgi:hypothetical protein